MATTMIASQGRASKWAAAPVAAGRTKAVGIGIVAAITGMCLLAAYCRWTKLNSLVAEDPAMWLFQGARAAWGETPYRDFSWNYPPLAILSLGWALRAFGTTFATAQALADALSAAVVFLCYAIARQFLPRPLHLPVIGLLVAAGVTVQVKFALFSLLTYSLALHFGAIGVLLSLYGCLGILQEPGRARRNFVFVVTGFFIAAFSKPESMLAAAVTLAVLAAAERRTRPLLWAGCLVPAGLAYATVAAWVGPGNLAAGMGGYGLATFACPWWPTGLGLFGMCAALGEAAAITGILSIGMGPRFRAARIAAPAGLAVFAAYCAYVNWPALIADGTLWRKIVAVAPSVLWTSPVLLPAMWSAIFFWLYAAAKRWRPDAFFLLLTPAVAMSSRSLFGTTLYPYTEVSAICYPLFLIIAPIFLWRFLSAGGARRTAAIRVGALCGAYALLRLAAGYPELLSGKNYHRLQTEAGTVSLRGDDGSAEIYRYVVDHTGKGDPILDIPYGGGINFAALRRSPAFTTEFNQLRMPERYQEQDLRQVAAARPKIVIAGQAAHFGTTYGWAGNMNCPCPRLVWQPDELSWDPGKVLPVARYLERNYRVAAAIGQRWLLAPVP